MEESDIILLAGRGPGNSFRELRRLSPLEASRVVRGAIELNRSRLGNPLFEIIRRNRDEFDAFLEQIVRNSDRRARERSLALAPSECNRLIINFIASFRMYVDHYTIIFSERHGSDSDVFRAWKTRCSAVYDESFGYRFAYRLRNHALHQSLPIGTLTFTEAEYEPSEPATKRHFGNGLHRCLLLAFRTADLLRDSTKWWSSVAQEIEARSPEIEVGSVVKDTFDSATKLHSFVEEQEFRRLREHALGLVGLVQEVTQKLPGYAPTLLTRGTEDPAATSLAQLGQRVLAIDLLTLPLDLIRQYL